MPTLLPGRNKGTEGFTLIEISISLAILAILLLTVLPRIPAVLGNTGDTILRTLSEKVESEFMRALLTGRRGTLAISLDLNSISFSTSENDEVEHWKVDCEGILDITKVKSNFGVDYSEGSVEIPFSPLGTIPETEITFRETSTSREIKVRFDSFTGRVFIHG